MINNLLLSFFIHVNVMSVDTSLLYLPLLQNENKLKEGLASRDRRVGPGLGPGRFRVSSINRVPVRVRKSLIDRVWVRVRKSVIDRVRVRVQKKLDPTISTC
jgi:hypothetical protein